MKVLLISIPIILFSVFGFLFGNGTKESSGEVNVLSYQELVKDNDWQPAIQKAIDDAYKNNEHVVLIPKELTIKSTINMKPGITLKGTSSPGFYNGLQWITDDNEDVTTAKIKAIKSINGSLIEYKEPINNKGITIEDLVLDGNKLVNDVFYAHSDKDLIEANIKLDNVGIQGALRDGVRLERVLTTKIDNSNISANGNYGVNFNIGASDSVLSENYIHGNQKGGIRMSSGSHYNQVISGKIEDNYGSGILLDGSGGGVTNHIVSSVVFHVNNESAINATNGATAIINSSQIAKNGVTQSNQYSTNILASGSNTVIQVSNSNFTVGDKTKYNATSLEQSKIIISDSVFNNQFYYYGTITSNQNTVIN
ncbi:right-handed parallel beta-helix repeat-containing protein [Niallia taxi]|uniref:right-handed parallel beta-helix repeat-containing protein n=1 Tax=Niallia taxi TaxID=2499688 RepID=UPI003009F6B0